MNADPADKKWIALGADHAGFALKEQLKAFLTEFGFEFQDYGTFSGTSTDYPDWGVRVARAVAAGQHSRGILVCGTGIGMSIVANRYRGVRAALCTSEYMAEICRRHNDANILVLGGRITTDDIAKRILKIWLETGFESGRHATRISKIDQLPVKPASV
ncbi:ribose 5-phosphate isomerase B [candidate division KSB1 bacterium]|nr:ribose 5-phosphate isomerase B [candidate division KSB1 bacterium]